MFDPNVEHNLNSLKRDFKNLRSAVLAGSPDSYTLAMLDKLNRSILENRRLVEDLLRK